MGVSGSAGRGAPTKRRRPKAQHSTATAQQQYLTALHLTVKVVQCEAHMRQKEGNKGMGSAVATAAGGAARQRGGIPCSSSRKKTGITMKRGRWG